MAFTIEPNDLQDAINFPSLDVTTPTLLTSVNFVLSSAGLREVPSVKSNIDSEGAMTELVRVSREFQSRSGQGWWFNKEPSVLLRPNADGEILVPGDVISMSPSNQSGMARIRGLTRRGHRIYDTTTRSTRIGEQFPDGVKFDLVTQWGYEELPDSFRDWVMYRAAINFAAGREYFEARLQGMAQLEQRAMIRVQQEDVLQLKQNYFEQNDSASSFASIVSGPNDTSYFGG